uniref:Uncharacterized protein n=1 Tax=Kalanchoe fedtschenkoi TaxID=63787 RepID=A0A7N0ZQP5_KALFE
MTILSIGASLDRLLPKFFSDFNHQRRRRPTHPLHRSLLSSSATAKHRNFGFSLQADGCCDSRFRANRCLSEFSSFEAEADQSSNYVSHPSSTQNIQQTKASFVEILRGANAIIPHVVLASTLLALIYPPSFTWFTSRYYAPALGFLMFAVGVNSSEKDFIEAFSRPSAMLAGYIGQFLVKPLLGYLCGVLAVTVFGMPTSIGAGIMLTSCVSGAQLSNYATFLTDPPLAPLSIVMTSLSTASAVFITPLLSLLLIGKRLPVDVRGMVSSITQIVISPIAAGLFLNRNAK